MLTYARRTLERARGLSREEFVQNESIQDAVAYNIMVIGEAATKVSPETQAAHPEIPWVDVRNMRHRIVHGYMSLDYEKLWGVVVDEIPLLIKALLKIIEKPSDPP
jgi:uncharacterized protein with HEPN domain